MILILNIVWAKPSIHPSVTSNKGNLLVTFKAANYEVARDPDALLQESRKKLPFLMSVDVETFTGRHGANSMYQRYRGEYVLNAAREQHEKDRVSTTDFVHCPCVCV